MTANEIYLGFGIIWNKTVNSLHNYFNRNATNIVGTAPQMELNINQLIKKTPYKTR